MLQARDRTDTLRLTESARIAGNDLVEEKPIRMIFLSAEKTEGLIRFGQIAESSSNGIAGRVI